MDDVCESRAPLVVTRQHGGSVVMLSLAEYKSLQETWHLLRDPQMPSICENQWRKPIPGILSKPVPRVSPNPILEE